VRLSAQRGTLVACILGSAVVFVDTTVINVALPALRKDLGAGLSTQQWTVDAYLLTLGSLVLLGGSLGDLMGRRRVFLAGLAGFGVASALCAAAPTAGVLIALRAVQGAAGALLVPSSLAIITEAFPGERERGAAIGSWTAWTSGAIAFGPPLGGALVDAVSWRAVFAINVPLVAAAMWMGRHCIPTFELRARRLDLRGGLLCAVGLAGPVFGLIEQPMHGWTSGLVLGPIAAGLVILAGFVALERHVVEPMLPLELFASRAFTVANTATVAFYAGLGALTFLVALYVQQVSGYSALEAGLTLTPVTVMMILFSRRFGALAASIGPRLVMGLGPLVAAGGALLFLRLGQRADYLSEVLPASALFGLGLAATVAPLTATVLSAATPQRAGVASGVNNALARVAGLLAVALVGVVISARYTQVLDAHHPRAPASVRGRPLTRPVGATPSLTRASLDASASAFRFGMGGAALLLALGGVVALAGLEPWHDCRASHDHLRQVL